MSFEEYSVRQVPTHAPRKSEWMKLILLCTSRRRQKNSLVASTYYKRVTSNLHKRDMKMVFFSPPLHIYSTPLDTAAGRGRSCAVKLFVWAAQLKDGHFAFSSTEYLRCVIPFHSPSHPQFCFLSVLFIPAAVSFDSTKRESIVTLRRCELGSISIWKIIFRARVHKTLLR